MVTFSLVVVRHGATDANEQGIIQGQSDHQLNKAGRQQALLLGRHFRQCPPFSTFTHSYASDLCRAKETAEIILRTIRSDQVQEYNDDEKFSGLVCDVRLRERRYGVLEGESTSLHKEKAMRSRLSPAEYTPQGGETLQELYARISEFFRDLCSRVTVGSRNSLTLRGTIVSSTPLCPTTMAENHQQQQNGSSLNRNNRLATPASKNNRIHSLVTLPEQTSPNRATTMEDSTISEDLQSQRGQDQSTQEPGTTSPPYNNVNHDLGTAENWIDHTTNDGAIEQPSSEEFSPFASSRDSGISAVSETSLSVDTTMADTIIFDAIDGPFKRTYSSCSSPGFSTCTASPCESSDIIGDETLEKAIGPPSSVQQLPSNNWAYVYGNGTRTAGARKVSVQSIASDDANVPELDAQILVVTHGGAIRELFRYFVDELGCLMIGGKGAALRPCPNTGVSSFMVHINPDNNDGNGLQQKNVSIICLGLHSKEHLTSTWSSMASNLDMDFDRGSTEWFSKRPETPPCDVSDFFIVDEENESSTSTLPK